MALPATTPHTPGPDRTPDQKRTGYRGWDARWDNDSRFRHQLRVLTAVWGTVFTLDAVVRVAFAYTLPLDAVPLATTLQWLVVLAGLITFHIVYVTRNGLKV